ncbi:hypothetical protein QMK19_25960 [Streptomyces sp. H10-C2]|uniref:hypothetical protein n=1 Tax=unclassified Streptomyces TaxID=2593676 RepID=UPI0024B8FDAE|nr:MULTISPECIES: hypothetical protein [unclassified Streptomyces]MDJ0345642.1 hypothetical protein [Streptomyces sp. PH10-H1]MDJ0373007.1 hypothetical protein [Streptomyces sp. H10-C2]
MTGGEVLALVCSIALVGLGLHTVLRSLLGLAPYKEQVVRLRRHHIGESASYLVLADILNERYTQAG